MCAVCDAADEVMQVLCVMLLRRGGVNSVCDAVEDRCGGRCACVCVVCDAADEVMQVLVLNCW